MTSPIMSRGRMPAVLAAFAITALGLSGCTAAGPSEPETTSAPAPEKTTAAPVVDEPEPDPTPWEPPEGRLEFGEFGEIHFQDLSNNYGAGFPAQLTITGIERDWQAPIPENGLPPCEPKYGEFVLVDARLVTGDATEGEKGYFVEYFIDAVSFEGRSPDRRDNSRSCLEKSVRIPTDVLPNQTYDFQVLVDTTPDPVAIRYSEWEDMPDSPTYQWRIPDEG